jgi:hypothetical protein
MGAARVSMAVSMILANEAAGVLEGPPLTDFIGRESASEEEDTAMLE